MPSARVFLSAGDGHLLAPGVEVGMEGETQSGQTPHIIHLGGRVMRLPFWGGGHLTRPLWELDWNAYLSEFEAGRSRP